MQQAILEIELFDEQVTEFAGTCPRLRKRHMDRELPASGRRKESEFGDVIEDENGLRVLDPHPIDLQIRKGISGERRKVSLFLCEPIQRPTDLDDVLDTFVAKGAAFRIRMPFRRDRTRAQKADEARRRDFVCLGFGFETAGEVQEMLCGGRIPTDRR